VVPTRCLRGPSPLKISLAVLSLAVLCARPDEARAQACNDSLASGNLSNIVNTYYAGVGSVAVNATSITVDLAAIRGASTTADIAIGDVLLVMQMQDAQFNQVNTVDYGDGGGGSAGAGSTAVNNSGRYEYVVAQTALTAGGVVTIRGAGAGPTYGLVNAYATVARDDEGGTRRGQRTFQVVRVARRATASLTSTLTAAPWDGRTGGVLAVDVAGNLNLNGATVSVNGLGFRGAVGISNAGDGSLLDTDYMTLDSDLGHGRKAEGIACTPDPLTQVSTASGTDGCPRGDRGRGGPGNAGGGGTDGNPTVNDENSGGGGGGNGGAGGLGGNTWNSNLAMGGRGGTAFAASTSALILGGGGGGGTSNNVGPGTGATGGGMVFFRTATVSGTGTITANGNAAFCSGQDGGGGGGAGGSVMFYAESGSLANLTLTAIGGRGGDGNFGTNGAINCAIQGNEHGPGGGGGGGVIFAARAVNAGSSVVGGQSGRTTGNVAYGSVAGSNGPAIDTTLTAAEVVGVQACTIATKASLAGLRVSPGVVEFATASQRGTLAFDLYATDDPQGLRGRRALARRVPSALPDTLDAVLYRVPVRGAMAGPYLVIDEIETNGRVHRLGPFTAGDAQLADAYARLAGRAQREETRTVRGAVMLTGRALSPVAPLRDAAVVVPFGGGAPVSGVKIETRGAGTVTVDFTDLVAAGLPPSVLKTPSALRVYRLGQLVPSTLVPEANSPTAVAFQAEPLETDFTDRAPYVVWYGRTAPPAPKVDLTRSGPPRRAGFLRVQENLYYAPFVHPGADPWIWDFLLTGQPPVVKTFALPALLPADTVAVAVHLSGGSTHAHRVQASLNGVALGGAQFEGRTTGLVQARIPRAVLRDTGNELTLTYTAKVAPEEIGVAFVDAVDLRVEAAPVPGQTAQVARIVAYDPLLPRLDDVDYLVVTHADFGDAAQRLAGLHAREGMQTAVVDVARAYDALAGGAFEAQAVRGLLGRLTVRKQPPTVVLFGDDTLDPRDYLGLGSVAFVPSLSGWDGSFGRIASENRYADQDGDGAPDLAIGRLPADSASSAALLVDKIERGSPPLGPHATQVVAIDDQGPSDVSFEGAAGRVAKWLPLSSAVWADVSQGVGVARATLQDGWRAGPVVVQYFGHAGAETWADEHLLTNGDVPALDGIGPAPFVFTWTCQAQWYQYHLGPSVNEALLLVPNGGALATVGPTGISDPGLQSQLAEGVLQRLAAGATLGEAIRAAKAEALARTPDARGVVEGFTLLGDPALVLGGPSPSSLGVRAEER
jgi:hypothetical protein